MNGTRMVTIVCMAGFLSAGAAGRAETYHRTLTPGILSEWTDSTDGKVSLCFTANKTTFSPAEKITLRCAIRNNTKEPLLVLRPFGDPFYAESAGLHILGPDGEIRYQGPMLEYVLGTLAFCELAPETVMDETFELPKNHFPGLGDLGLYRIRYEYRSSEYPKEPKPGNYWSGGVSPGAVYILVMEKNPTKANAGDGK